MTDRQSTRIGVALVCLTVGGTTCYQGQRIDDLRVDLTRDIETLRADVRETRQIMISHLDQHQAD